MANHELNFKLSKKSHCWRISDTLTSLFLERFKKTNFSSKTWNFKRRLRRRIMFKKCTCALTTLVDRRTTESPQKIFSSKIYSISILNFTLVTTTRRKKFPFSSSPRFNGKSEIFSHFAAGLCATKRLRFFFQVFTWWQIRKENENVLRLFSFSATD